MTKRRRGLRGLPSEHRAKERQHLRLVAQRLRTTRALLHRPDVLCSTKMAALLAIHNNLVRAVGEAGWVPLGSASSYKKLSAEQARLWKIFKRTCVGVCDDYVLRPSPVTR